MMLSRTKNGVESIAPTRIGAETDVAAHGRELARLARAIRDNHPDDDVRVIADAVLLLGALVYANR